MISDSSTPIGTRVMRGASWIASGDGRQFRLEDGLVVQEILPSSPLWREFGRSGMHWSEWARALRS